MPVRQKRAESTGRTSDDDTRGEDEMRNLDNFNNTPQRRDEGFPRNRDEQKKQSSNQEITDDYTSVEDYDPIKEMVKCRLRELEPLRELIGPDLEHLSKRTEPLLSSPDVPEVVFAGEIVEASGFDVHGVNVHFKFVWEEPFIHVEGDVTGKTQTGIVDATGKRAPLNHPFEVHFAAPSTVGWPKLVLDIRGHDEHGRSLAAGYGFCHMPMLPGVSAIDMHCWRPIGSMRDEAITFFLGSTGGLATDDIICADSAFTSRCRLITVAAGKVKMHVSTFLRHFDGYGIDTAMNVPLGASSG